MKHPDIRILRKKLVLLGDLPESENDNISILYDKSLLQAVISFQKRHGIGDSGIVGKETKAHLNIPIKKRAEQLALNMHRWRDIPKKLGDKYIFVNMADYHLHFVNNGKTELDMKVIIGKPYRSTPSMKNSINHIVINPPWNVPRRIAVQDLLPKIKKKKNYLDKNHYQLIKGWGKTEEIINPNDINLSSLSGRNFPYRLRQKPGDHNALGRIKFNFPNDYSIYLHGTPKQNLFNRQTRAFSSGCIRVEFPELLASKLLSDSGWSLDKIKKQKASQKTVYVNLQKTVPVYLMYWTSWVDPNGSVNFRDDIYKRDRYFSQNKNTGATSVMM